MTIIKKLEHQFPVEIYYRLSNQSKKQGKWKHDDIANRWMIDRLINWKQTIEGNEFWKSVNSAVIKNFDNEVDLFNSLCVILKSQKDKEQSDQKLSHEASTTKEGANENKQKKENMKLSKYEGQMVAKVTLVEGEDISDLAPDAIISRIKAYKRATKDLEEAGISGAYLEQERAKFATAVQTLQTELNSRAATVTPGPEA